MPVKRISDPLTIGQAINSAILKLTDSGSESPSSEAEILIQHITGMQRFELYMNRCEPIRSQDNQKLQVLLADRIAGQPLQYITGVAYFGDLKLEVSPAVLIPRPETEQLVELVIEHIRHMDKAKPLRIVDVGTGSGAIVISLAKAFSESNIEFIATDMSIAALDTARRNASIYKRDNIKFTCTSLIDDVDDVIDVIVANLPYIPTASLAGLPADVQKEPHTALDGGACGYETIEKLIIESSGKMRNGSLLFLEIGIGQDNQITRLMADNGFNNIRVLKDLAGIKRFIIGEYFV